MLKSWIKKHFNRRATMEQLSTELGLSFSVKDEFGLFNLLKDFRLFQKGGLKGIQYILSSKSDFLETDLRIFDYQYTISTGKSSVTYKQTVFFVQSKQLNLPQFFLRPERFFHKIGNLFGIKDINFEEHPVFSEQYWLKGNSESLIRKTMNEDVLHFFTIEKEWNLEGLNYFLIFYKHKHLMGEEELVDFYQKGNEIVKLFSNPS